MVPARARAGRGPPAEAGASGVSGEMKGRKGQPVSPGHSRQKEPHVARFLGEDRGGEEGGDGHAQQHVGVRSGGPAPVSARRESAFGLRNSARRLFY